MSTPDHLSRTDGPPIRKIFGAIAIEAVRSTPEAAKAIASLDNTRLEEAHKTRSIRTKRRLRKLYEKHGAEYPG